MSVQLPQVPGVTHRYVTARGVRFHVAEAGPADGEPVVLLHGFPQHWYAWRHVVRLLAADYRVIAPDMRGFGWSEAPRHGYGVVNLADDVVAVLDELGIERARVIGHDWGAWAAFYAAVRHPERVSALVSVNMPHLWPRKRALLPNAWRMWHTAPMEWPPLGRFVIGRTGFTRFLLRHWVADKEIWDPEELDVYTSVLREPARARAGEQVNAAYVWQEIMAHPRGRYGKARLAVPVLLLAGERDVVAPPAVFAGGEEHAEMRLVVVPDCGHLMPEEWPEVVADEATAFFRETATPRLIRGFRSAA